MNERVVRIFLVMMATLAASPALALNDLDGIYTGKFACQGATDFATLDSTVEGALYVDEGQNNIVSVHFPNAGLYFRTTVVSAPDEDSFGRLGGPDCDVTPTVGGHFLQAEVKAKPGSDKASLKGEFVTLRVGGSADHLVEVCRFNLKRTNPLPQSIPLCPPQ